MRVAAQLVSFGFRFSTAEWEVLEENESSEKESAEE